MNWTAFQIAWLFAFGPLDPDGGMSLLPGWGDKPHHDIVDASLSALPVEDRLVERLGPKRANFPGAPRSYQNDVPYRPLFIRALQALRTESPANAVSWLGSLLHFVTDTGSPPPHALVYKGDIQANDRARYEPIALESAAETALVVADTLHTLLVLSAGPVSGGELRAEVRAVSAAEIEGLPRVR